MSETRASAPRVVKMPRTEHVIALDPGERTGWATANMSKDHFEFIDYGAENRKVLAQALAHKQFTIEGDEPHRTYDVLVWETWKPHRQNGSMDWIEGDNLLSARHIGHFELIAWLSGAKTKEYPPSQKDHFQASMPPQLVELQRGASEQHPKDAIMHLWGYFFENWFTARKAPEDCVVL